MIPVPSSLELAVKPIRSTRKLVIQNGRAYVFVGKENPLADCRGYALRARLVASAVMGHWLAPDEKVIRLHPDEMLNDDPVNLVVVRRKGRPR